MNKKDWLINNAPTILTGLGCVGTVVTAGLAVKAGMKIADICSDDRRFKVEASNEGDDWIEIEVKSNEEYYTQYRITKKSDRKDVIKACIPVAVSSVVTLACNISADILNRRQKSDLLAICALVGSSYSGYRQDIIKRYGREIDKEIVDTVASNCSVCYMAPDIPDNMCHWVLDLYCDGLPRFEFDAFERDVLHAEMHFNRNYIYSGDANVVDLLNMLGICVKNEENSLLNSYGWSINDDEIYYIDFEHMKIDENTVKIYPVFSPWKKFWDKNMWGEEC